MDENDKQPNLLDLFKGMLEDHLGKKEFLKAFAQVIEYVKESDTKATEAVKAIAATLIEKADQLKSGNAAEFATHKADALALIARELTKFVSLIDEKLAPLSSRIDAIKQTDEAELLVRFLAAVQLPEQKEILLDTPEDIRNKLELLHGDERLDAKAIKGLDERLNELENRKPIYVGSGAANRGQVKGYDLSASLNGVTKTFNTPAMWRPVSIHLSSFPGILRETVDYTWTPQTVTFTSEIDAATTLAAGQTAVLVYMEA